MPAVQVFFDMVSNKIRKLSDTHWGHDNITKEERLALQQLKKRKDLVIKEADKGGNVVIWPTDMYINEAKRYLGNKFFCVILPSDSTEILFKKKLDLLLTTATQLDIISKQERMFLTVDTATIPTFFMSPKVHKSLQEPPGRPFISGIGGLNEKVCQYVDYYLQPFVLQLTSYIRNSSYLISQLDQVAIPDGALLVTFDVESLYTIIQHEVGISAVMYLLEKTRTVDTTHYWLTY